MHLAASDEPYGPECGDEQASEIMKRVVGLLIGLISCAILALGLFEVYLRSTEKQTKWATVNQLTPFRHSKYYEFKPYMNFGEHPLLGHYPFVRSKRGLLTKSKPTNDFRIFVFGGSVVQSYGHSNDTGDLKVSGMFSPPGEWWAYLEDQLNAKKPPRLSGITFRVASAGGQSYITTNELVKFFLSDIDEYQPDYVVFLDGYNDFNQTFLYGSPPGVDLFALGLEARSKLPLAFWIYKNFGWSRAISQVARTSLHLYMVARLSTDAKPEDLANAIFRNYRKAKIYADGIDAGFIVALQPFRRLHRTKGEYPESDPIRAQYIETRHAITEKLSKSRITYSDYTEMFDAPGGPGAVVFYDDVHFVDAGYRHLVDTLVRDHSAEIFAAAADGRSASQ